MKLLIYSRDESALDGFKSGHAWASDGFDYQREYTQGVDARGYWLLIEDGTGGDNATYELTPDRGLVFTDTGVEV